MNLNGDQPKTIRFDEFVLDSSDESLRRNGEKLMINRRMFQVLWLLIERRGEIVTKHEFFDEVWAGSFVEDNNLTVTITALRKALGETAKNARFIENIPRKGYRFIGKAEYDAAGTAEDVVLGPEHDERNGGKKFLLAGAAISILIVLLLGIVSFSGGLGGKANKVAAKQTAVAVLPFSFRNEESEYLADGISDGLSKSLGRIPALSVSDRNSTNNFKGKEVDLSDAASQLGVETIIRGEVERAGGTLVIIVEAVNVNDPARSWRRQFRRTEAELFGTQQEIVNEILTGLKIGPIDAKPETEHDPKALELYLKARYYLNRRAEVDIQHSTELFKKTIDVDPGFALAYVGLSEAYTLGSFPSVTFAPGEKNSLIRATIQKAIDIDPNVGEAYAARAINRCYYDWDFAGAESDYRKAIELVPSDATAHHWYAEFLSMQGRFDESYREYDKAISLDPLSMAIKTDLALAHFYARDYDGAMEMLQSVKTLDPGFLRTENFISWIHRVRGEFRSAIDSFEHYGLVEADKNRRIDLPLVTSNIAKLRDGFSRNGAKGYWMADSEIYGSDMIQPAFAMAQIGEKDRAFELLNGAFDKRQTGLVWLKVEPLLDPLRSDPRFADLMARVGFVK